MRQGEQFLIGRIAYDYVLSGVAENAQTFWAIGNEKSGIRIAVVFRVSVDIQS